MEYIKLPIRTAVRLKCLDCCCGQRNVISNCPIEKCSLWYYRPFQGKDAIKGFVPEHKIDAVFGVDLLSPTSKAKLKKRTFTEREIIGHNPKRTHIPSQATIAKMLAARKNKAVSAKKVGFRGLIKWKT